MGKARRWQCTALGLLGLTGALDIADGAGASAHHTHCHSSGAQSNRAASRARPAPAWTIRRQGAAIPQGRFEVRIDGVKSGRTKLLVFAHRVGRTSRLPQVLAIASSGYLRLKAGADPLPALPFGQSLVLGPAVFGTSTSFPGQPRLFYNPQIQRVDVDRSGLDRNGRGSLRIKVTAADRNLAPNRTETNQIANLTWRLVLHEPTAAKTRLDVDGRFRFTEQVTPDSTRTAELQSFRLVQVSSMFIDSSRHDVDGFRYRSANGQVDVRFDPGMAGSLLPSAPSALASNRPVLDVIHSDDAGQPNGNTPSYRIRFGLTSGPLSGPRTPRAFFNSSQDLNDDNLGVWVHKRPHEVIPKGATGRITLTVLATEDPLPPP
jgi:predicted CxxxxCH...CXXCH cytochrome family protein